MSILRPRKIICGNWKMNTSRKKALELVLNIEKNLPKTNIEVIICPPFLYLEGIFNAIKKVKLGAQNCSAEKGGAFTGEVSAVQLADFCKYVILGHSERRIYQKETDEEISRKVKAALKAKLSPIVCIGESKSERNKKQTSKVIKRQVLAIIKGLSKNEVLKTIFVYEPVWAISTFGSKEILKPSLVIPEVRLVRKIIAAKFGKDVLKNIPLLYGGSVSSKNAKEIQKEKEIDGVLVGVKSLDAKDFVKIVEIFNKDKNVSNR